MKLFSGEALNIAGHKVPLQVLAIAATIGAALLLIRRSSNANAAALEQQQASGGGVFGGASGTDLSGSLANLQSMIASLRDGAAAAVAPVVTAVTPSTPSGPSAAGSVPKALGSDPTPGFSRALSSAPIPTAPVIPPASPKKTFVDSPLFRQPVYPSDPGTRYPGTTTLSLARDITLLNPRTQVKTVIPQPPAQVTVDLNPRSAGVGFNPIRGRGTGTLAQQ